MKYLRMPGSPWPVFPKPFIVLAHDNAAMAGVFAEVFAGVGGPSQAREFRMLTKHVFQHTKDCFRYCFRLLLVIPRHRLR